MFKFLITPYLVDIAYILGSLFPFFLIYYFYDKIHFIFTKEYKYKVKFLLLLAISIIMYEIMLRVFFEFIIVYFNMYEELQKIGEKL